MNHDVLVFIAGSAVGAVTAGLIVHYGEKSHRNVLEEQVQEALRAVARADEAALRATSQVGGQADAQADVRVVTRVEEHHAENRGALQSTSPLDGRKVKEHIDSQEATHQAPLQEERPHETEDVPSQDERPAVPKHDAKSVKSVLQERLGVHMFEDMPVIDRGEVRQGPSEELTLRPHKVSAHHTARVFDPTARAAVIDKRVPRFDESLFPDTKAEVTHEEDDFVTAMRAMDDAMAVAEAHEYDDDLQTAPDAERPEFSDATSYVDYLIQDELRRNRDAAGRRYSRQHLTVYEGTGDLSAARHALKNRGKHLPPITLEA